MIIPLQMGSLEEAAAGILDSAVKRLLDRGIDPAAPLVPAPVEGSLRPLGVVRELSTKEHLRLCRQACREAVGLPKDGSNN